MAKKTKKTKLNLKALLAVLLLLLLAWWYWSMQASNPTPKPADQAKEQPAKEASKETKTDPGTPAASEEASAGYVNITQWGVRFKNKASLGVPKYMIKPFEKEGGGSSEAAYFTTEALETAAANCSASNGAIGAIGRYVAGDDYGDGKIENNTSAIKVGTYYYVYTQPQAFCSDNTTTQATETQLIGVIREAIKSLELIP